MESPRLFGRDVKFWKDMDEFFSCPPIPNVINPIDEDPGFRPFSENSPLKKYSDWTVDELEVDPSMPEDEELWTSMARVSIL